MGETDDRTSQDTSNILSLEHVNVRVPDQALATLFYVVGLGLTRDPYLMVGTENMWVNVGQEQFHLPTGPPQLVRGRVDLVTPDLDALVARLGAVESALAGTRFRYAVEDKHVAVTCPWGNRLRCWAPRPAVDPVPLAIARVEFAVPPGTADGIRRFYARVLEAPAAAVDDGGAPATRVRIGVRQELVFRETDEPIRAYDGHHIAIYLANFSRPHAFLRQHGLITEESSAHQYRFERLVDPDTLAPLFEVEHEVRSFAHPMYLRPLVNRNPAQRLRTYARGRDAFVP